ncbi:MAG: GIY-YIG nuclease family protein [Pseudomonadota bacterium]
MLRCADGSLYTGIAIDVVQRLEQHASGVGGAKYLRGRTPFELVFEQPVGDRSRASQAEYRVKRLARVDKKRLIAGSLTLGDVLENAVQASGVGGG